MRKLNKSEDDKKSSKEPKDKRRKKSVKSKESQSLQFSIQEEKHEETETKSQCPTPTIQESHIQQIWRLIRKCDLNPSSCLDGLLKLYERDQQLFFRRNQKESARQQGQIRPLYLFVQQVISYSEDFPFLYKEKTIKIFEELLSLVTNHNNLLTTQEIHLLQEINDTLWKQFSKKQTDRILVNGVNYFLKLSLMLAKTPQNSAYHSLAGQLIEVNAKNLIKALQQSNMFQNSIKEMIIEYYESILEVVSLYPFQKWLRLPLYDLLALSITSKHAQIYERIIQNISSYLKNRLNDKRQFDGEEEKKEQIQNESTIRVLLTVCNVFDFCSILAGSRASQSLFYVKEVVFLVTHNYRGLFAKLVDELQKIQKSSVPKEIIRSMFQMVVNGTSISQPQQLKQIIPNILSTVQMKRYFNHQKLEEDSQNKTQCLEGLVKVTQKAIFELLYRIQKALCHYNLDHYMDLYVERPFAFRSEYFIQTLFKTQHEETIFTFMYHFTQKWVCVQIKKFDFNFYLIHFFKKCIKKDLIKLIGRYIRKLTVQQLLKIAQIIYKLSFEQDKKKYGIPEPHQENVVLAQITSAGFCDKYMFINKIMPDFSEQLLWKETIYSMKASTSYIYVKTFYNVVNYELNFHDFNVPKFMKIVQYLQFAIKQQKIEEVYSIFQIVTCLSFKPILIQKLQKQNKNKFEVQVFKVLIEKAKQIISMCEFVCERRRAAMSHVRMSSEMINDNVKYFQKVKKMHSLFLKSVVGWLNRIDHVQEIVPKGVKYEEVIQICLQLEKNVEFGQFRIIRCLQEYCSDKYFSNTLQTKIRTKICQKQPITTSQLLLLREILYFGMRKYEHKPIQNMTSILEESIKYFGIVLQSKLMISNERQTLRQKVIVLDVFTQLTQFFNQNPYHLYSENYLKYYKTSLKDVIRQIALQNSEIVSKYERQLILHLRTTAIKHILRFFKTSYEVFSSQECFNFIFQLCLDKMVQIRLLVFNILVSRFKSNHYQRFLSKKDHVTVYLTIFAIFEPHALLKASANKIIETIKKTTEQEHFVALTVFLYCLKLILEHILNGCRREEYYVFVDYFCKKFDSLWLNKKECEYSVYYFCQKGLQQKTIQFQIPQVKYWSHIQSYMTARQKSDFILETQIKAYLRSDFDFQFPPDEPFPDFKSKFIKDVMEELPLRIYRRVVSLIMDKPRSTRVLKGKKAIKINWKALEEAGLIYLLEVPINGEKVNFSFSRN